jgi:hypothetical protein
MGVFLLLYKGYNLFEDRILDAAGLSAVGIALFPMNPAGDCVDTGVSPHGIFAIVFFACISVICIFMSRHSLKEMKDPQRRDFFRYAYYVCAFFMAGSIVTALVFKILPAAYSYYLCENSIIFWVEATGVWAFSAFWYIKTRELNPSVSWIPFRKI